MSEARCAHRRVKSVDCVIFCLDCGARVEGDRPLPPASQAPSPKGEGTGKAKRTRRKEEKS